MTIGKLRRILRYFSRFGLRAGLQAARLHGPTGQIVTIRLPGIKNHLWAHAGTADVESFEEVFVTRHYDLPFENFFPGSILDLGANVGYASVYFASRWNNSRILAVEPAPDNIALLRRNTEAWPNIGYLQAAVWSHPATVNVANPSEASNAFRMNEASSHDDGGIPAYTVTQLMERQGWRHLDLLKMDVEGAEAQIFREGTDWLDRVSVMFVELHDRIVPGCAEALGHALRGRRFRQEIVGGNLAIDLRAQS